MTSQDRLSCLLAGTGAAGVAAAVVASPADAAAAVSQDWSPFVLVTGQLLIGLVANDDGLFATAGHQLARVARVARSGRSGGWMPVVPGGRPARPAGRVS